MNERGVNERGERATNNNAAAAAVHIILTTELTSNNERMSADKTATDAANTCCASCGIAEVDDVKLKECDGCDLVRYCCDECKELHRPQHETKCKERAAELRDEILFRQPESSLGDCPICCVPFSNNEENSTNRVQTCCSKIICAGCTYANDLRQRRENKQQICPFCRHPVPKTQEEAEKNKMKRIEANDPVAMSRMGFRHLNEGDYESAFKYFTKAAELGDAAAQYDLSIMFREGEGVEVDEKMGLYHMEQAAIAGHALARQSLGVYEERNGRIERAVKHFIIAANLGLDDAINALKEYYKRGLLVSKDDFAAALRAHHAAVEATKSPQREEVKKYYAVHR